MPDLPDDTQDFQKDPPTADVPRKGGDGAGDPSGQPLDDPNPRAADSTRTKVARLLIGAGFSLLLLSFYAAYDSVTGLELMKPEVMQTTGYPYLLGGRGLVGASAITASFGLIKVGQRMLLPAAFVRDMLKRGGKGEQDGDGTGVELMTAAAGLMTAVTAMLPGVQTKGGK
jgi:hypothetical protein